jgi:hypothetical protein
LTIKSVTSDVWRRTARGYARPTSDLPPSDGFWESGGAAWSESPPPFTGLYRLVPPFEKVRGGEVPPERLYSSGRVLRAAIRLNSPLFGFFGGRRGMGLIGRMGRMRRVSETRTFAAFRRLPPLGTAWRRLAAGRGMKLQAVVVVTRRNGDWKVPITRRQECRRYGSGEKPLNAA